MSWIERRLLRARRVPCVDGLFRADGTSLGAAVEGPALSRFEIGPPLELGDSDDYDVMDIDPAMCVELPDRGSVCCGEGMLGADGFFARLDGDGNPIWVVVLTNSNPFVKAEVAGTAATFTNNLGNSVVIDLRDPNLASH